MEIKYEAYVALLAQIELLQAENRRLRASLGSEGDVLEARSVSVGPETQPPSGGKR